MKKTIHGYNEANQKQFTLSFYESDKGLEYTGGGAKYCTSKQMDAYQKASLYLQNNDLEKCLESKDIESELRNLFINSPPIIIDPPDMSFYEAQYKERMKDVEKYLEGNNGIIKKIISAIKKYLRM